VLGEKQKVEQKLYYQDAYLRNFSGHVLRQELDLFGRWFVVLDQTAFYPTGGGQPHDTGTINDIRVTDVEEIDGEIRHFIEKPLAKTDEPVFGAIDWQRRFDHMQQHAGQHILSAAFAELFGLETVSFHLGSEVSTIDLDIGDLTMAQAEEAEARANEIILENRLIETVWVTAAEAAKYPLRKKLSVSENIRLVIIPDFDYNGCGGTHPSSTGQVAAIKILGWERQKKKIRVQFVCGNRVLAQLGKKQQILKDLSPLLNAPETEMAAVVRKMLETAKERDKALEEARACLLQYEAKYLAQNAREVSSSKVISGVFQNRPVQEMQQLARMAAAESPDAMVIFISENAERLQIVCARGESAQGSMKKLMAELLAMINGKGGGNETFAQGGGEASITGEELLEAALEKLG
jgi:alanyl-tRNA synthetase